jgi:hypothetical protein
VGPGTQCRAFCTQARSIFRPERLEGLTKQTAILGAAAWRPKWYLPALSSYVRAHACMWFTHTHIYICIYIQIYITTVLVCVYICMHVCVYLSVFLSVYPSVYAGRYTHPFIHLFIHLFIIILLVMSVLYIRTYKSIARQTVVAPGFALLRM